MALKRPSSKKADLEVEPEADLEVEPEGALPPAAQEAVEASLAAAQIEAESRRAVAQDLVDDGFAIVNSGQDEDGKHWFVGQKDGEEKTVYVEGES